ncbi:MAG: hypothetical protein DI598_15270 [Pseudopedobacter saltans]|uniref:Uncharacterized protein n=1 Tax=Pseudopedobacter saltans TaxID=151895 RepID=A0A2W5EKS5_9SPHI|nr:MAG: hypothetical protein DI598_15270 [Pseudopedobacter saltans]
MKKYNRLFDLPYGGVKEVAQRAKVSVFTVGNVLRGKSQNKRVLEEVRNFLKEIEDVKQEIQNHSNNI